MLTFLEPNGRKGDDHHEYLLHGIKRVGELTGLLRKTSSFDSRPIKPGGLNANLYGYFTKCHLRRVCCDIALVFKYLQEKQVGLTILEAALLHLLEETFPCIWKEPSQENTTLFTKGVFILEPLDTKPNEDHKIRHIFKKFFVGLNETFITDNFTTSEKIFVFDLEQQRILFETLVTDVEDDLEQQRILSCRTVILAKSGNSSISNSAQGVASSGLIEQLEGLCLK